MRSVQCRRRVTATNICYGRFTPTIILLVVIVRGRRAPEPEWPDQRRFSARCRRATIDNVQCAWASPRFVPPKPCSTRIPTGLLAVVRQRPGHWRPDERSANPSRAVIFVPGQRDVPFLCLFRFQNNNAIFPSGRFRVVYISVGSGNEIGQTHRIQTVAWPPKISNSVRVKTNQKKKKTIYFYYSKYSSNIRVCIFDRSLDFISITN